MYPYHILCGVRMWITFRRWLRGPEAPPLDSEAVADLKRIALRHVLELAERMDKVERDCRAVLLDTQTLQERVYRMHQKLVRRAAMALAGPHDEPAEESEGDVAPAESPLALRQRMRGR